MGACGPRHIPLAGEGGPVFANGTPAARMVNGGAWEMHPLAWGVVAAFLVLVGGRAMGWWD